MGQTLSSLHLHHHQPAACLNQTSPSCRKLQRYGSANSFQQVQSPERILTVVCCRTLSGPVGWIYMMGGVTVCPKVRPLSGKLTAVGKQTLAVPKTFLHFLLKM